MKAPSVNPDEPESRTSLTLLEKIRQKDQMAWERLVNLYSPLVYHWCRQQGLQQADAEEVGQEVFLAVARKIADFHRDREGDTFRGWLRIITRHKILDHAEPPGARGMGGTDAQDQFLRLPADDVGSGSSDDATERHVLYQRAVQMIESEFELNTRRAFWLRLAGKHAADVAEELSMSVGAVHTAKSKVLKRLREEFGDLLNEFPR